MYNIENKTRSSKMYCSNCGKFGHIYKQCKDPVTSLGIISVHLNIPHVNQFSDDSLKNICFNNTIDQYGDKLDIYRYNNNNLGNLRNILKSKNKIKFLLIQRKHTLTFIEFIRGRYKVDNFNQINSLFELMSNQEIDRIRNSTFRELWNNLWKGTANSKQYLKEFNTSRNKFNTIIKNISQIGYLTGEIKSNYETPEWGFPKGRRNNYENNYDCAIREYTEETNITSNDILILDYIDPVEEKYIGSNGVTYRHLYYMALNKSSVDVNIDKTNESQFNEVGNIGWFTYDDASKIIRPYHIEKRKVLSQVFLFMNNMVSKILKSYQNDNQEKI